MMLTMILVPCVSHEPGHGHSGLESDPGKRQARLQTHSSHVPQMVTEPVSAKNAAFVVDTLPRNLK